MDRGFEIQVLCETNDRLSDKFGSDLDGNRIETQVDTFDTLDEANQFMEGPLFEENPIGTDFDPEELVQRLKAGEDHTTIKKRVEIGSRLDLPPGFGGGRDGQAPDVAI